MTLLRRLLGYLRPYAGRMVAAALMLAVAGGLMSVVVATLKPLVNEVLLAPGVSPAVAPPETSATASVDVLQKVSEWLPAREWTRWLRQRAFVAVPLLIIAVFFVRGVFLYFGQYLTTKTGASVIRNIRAELYEKIVFQSLRFFHTHTTGVLVSRVFADVQRLQRISTEVLADLVRVSTMVPFLIVVILLHEWRISAVALMAIPVVVYPMARLGQRLRRASRSSQENMAEATSLLTETVSGIKVVQSFAMERLGIGRFRAALGRMLRADLKAGRAAALSSPLLEQVAAFTGAAIFYLAGVNIARGRLDPGDFAVSVAGLGLLLISFRRLNRVNVEMQQALAAAERVFAVLDEEQEIHNAPGARPLSSFRQGIGFEGVEFAYEDEAVLLGVDLAISRGEMVALVGPSGSGKTTLANLLPRFYDPTAGRVTIDGQSIREVTVDSLRALIGLVTQETVLFDDTVHFNITHGREEASPDRVRDAARAAQAEGFINRMPAGYETRLGEHGARLSMGQRQRIAIARALYKDPPILILDEATSALDSESERLVQEALDTLLEGRTSIVIAHRLATVRRADRILVLDSGRIVEEGSHGQLLAGGGLYARLHELQFRDA